MADNAIWAVTGPEHDARMARELAWIATGGQTGIVGPESLEVLAQNTPNGTVRIMPGGMSISATSERANIGYTSAPWQSYMRAVYQPIDVEIDATGSSGGRTDVVGIVVDDPEFEGTSPDPDTHQYWRPHVVKNAGNNATRPEHFASLGRPFLPLAQVRIPSSTATITDSMVHDIRFLAVSRTYPVPMNAMQSNTVEVSSTNTWADIYTMSNIQVPQWATHAQFSGSVSGMQVVGSGTCTGQLRGAFNPGSGRAWDTYFREQGASHGTRLHLPVQGSVRLRAGEPGSMASFDFTLRRTFGDTVLRVAENDVRYDLTITFTEEPVHQ